MPQRKKTGAAVSMSLADVRVQVEYVAPATLKPAKNVVRKHSHAQIKRLARSMADFGPVIPVLIDAENRIIDGHACMSAAVQLGLAQIPVIRIEHLAEPQVRMLRLALNKLSEESRWDLNALRVEFGEIMLLDRTIDLSSSGFTIPQRDIIFGNHGAVELDDGDAEPEPVTGPPVSEVGDTVLMGPHRLVCGDARNPAIIAQAMGGERAGAVVSDLPYDVAIEGNVSGRGAVKHKNFAMASAASSLAHRLTDLSGGMVRTASGVGRPVFELIRRASDTLLARGSDQLDARNAAVVARRMHGDGAIAYLEGRLRKLRSRRDRRICRLALRHLKGREPDPS